MGKIIQIFKIPELRQKIFFTLMILIIYRIGFWIPIPIVDQQKMMQAYEDWQSGGLGQLLNIAALFSGANFQRSCIFGLGIMPYISASIIFQLLASVYPPLEKLQKEGESGRKKINEYTRYATVLIAFIQSYILISGMRSAGPQGTGVLYPEYDTFYYVFTAVMTMTAGTIFLMWLGEQIDEYGIGNGISLIIMAGILARLPSAVAYLFLNPTESGEFFRSSVWQLGGGGGSDPFSFEMLVVLVVLFVAIVMGVVAITRAQRRIPTQSARHVRGRRMTVGQRDYLPLRVNQAGVMPVIFASSLLMIPYFIFNFLRNVSGGEWEWANTLANDFSMHGYIYLLSYIFLIYFFCYFWTAITFKPKDIASNLQDYGTFIPGYRPGKRTAEYLERVMLRITYVGAAFLAIVAIIPDIIASPAVMGIPPLIASFYGGTGLLIVVSVALDLVQKIDSHLVMRNYESLSAG